MEAPFEFEDEESDVDTTIHTPGEEEWEETPPSGAKGGTAPVRDEDWEREMVYGDFGMPEE